METSKPDTFRLMLDTADRQIRRFAVLMVLLNVGLPLGLLAYAKLTGEPYWRLFRGEDSVADWFSSVQMLLIAAVAYLNHFTAGLWRRFNLQDPPRHPWVWLVFTFGFVVLALDERFDIHEALRDDLLEPSHLFVDIPWLIDGDAGLYLFLAVGLAFTPFLWDEFRREPPSLALYLAALGLSLPAIVIDGLPGRVLAEWPAWRFWDYTFEELAEVWAQLLFLLCFLVVLSRRLRPIADVTTPKRAFDEVDLQSPPAE